MEIKSRPMIDLLTIVFISVVIQSDRTETILAEKGSEEIFYRVSAFPESPKIDGVMKNAAGVEKYNTARK